MGKEYKEGTMGGTTNTKGHLKNHKETYHSSSFLKYIHIWKESKWSHEVIGETMSQLGILCCK